MAQHVIYIPGLGDRHSRGQTIALQLWRLFGLTPHYLPLGWMNPEGFDAKLNRLLTLYDQLKAAGHSVSLVGTSAGASAVLSAFAVRTDVTAVVCISGKINNPHAVSAQTYTDNPDFKESMFRLGDALNALTPERRSKIMSIHPWRDQTVPIEDTKIPGAIEVTVPGFRHADGIFFAIVFGTFKISRFIHHKAT